MNIASVLIKDIFRKKLRVFLTIFGIGIGVCVCIVMLGIGESIKHSFRDAYGNHQIDIVVQENDQPSILLSRVDADVARQIRALPPVDGAGGVLLYFHKLKSAAVPVFGWEPNAFLFDTVELTQGREPVAGKKEAMVGMLLMRSMQKDHERQIKIKGQAFDVVGVFKSRSPFEQSAVVVPLPDLQAALREEGKASFINVRLKPAFRTEDAIEGMLKEIEGALPLVTAMRADAFVAEKTKFIVMGEQFSLLVGVVTLIAVALGLANTMVTSSFEKRKFLSILLALGWPKTAIAMVFLCESAAVALMGGTLGVFLGLKGTAYVFSLSSIQAFAPELSLVFILKIVGLLLCGALFAGLVPAWITLHSNPVEVIRGE
jgi:putative ABC transport system permease protein